MGWWVERTLYVSRVSSSKLELLSVSKLDKAVESSSSVAKFVRSIWLLQGQFCRYRLRCYCRYLSEKLVWLLAEYAE